MSIYFKETQPLLEWKSSQCPVGAAGTHKVNRRYHVGASVTACCISNQAGCYDYTIFKRYMYIVGISTSHLYWLSFPMSLPLTVLMTDLRIRSCRFWQSGLLWATCIHFWWSGTAAWVPTFGRGWGTGVKLPLVQQVQCHRSPEPKGAHWTLIIAVFYYPNSS